MARTLLIAAVVLPIAAYAFVYAALATFEDPTPEEPA